MVRALNGDKAPGPYGFSMTFFQTRWKVLKVDIMNVFQKFHLRRKFKKSLDATFISLVPNRAETAYIKDFRSISLVSGVYKII